MRGTETPRSTLIDVRPSEHTRWCQNIVVPLPPESVDPEHAAEAALPFARAVAERTGAAVTLLSVVDLSSPFNPLTRMVTQPATAVEASLVAEAQANLSRLANAFPTSLVDNVVRVGSAASQILAILGERDHPLLVLCSHTRTGLDRLLFGSVASDLVHTAPCPMLVVRGPQSAATHEVASLSKVVVPLDQSSLAEHAISSALTALGPTDLHLHLLHVVEPGPYVGIASTELAALVEPKITRYLQEIAQPLLAQGYRVTAEVRDGKPSDEIAQVATEQGADLIAMTTHGRGGFHRVLLGSIVERLLHTSPVPLLLVRPAETGGTAHETDEAGRTVDRRREPLPAAPALWKRLVRELMVQPVVVASEETPLEEVAMAMRQNGVGCVPVVGEHGQLVGIVTESDVLRADLGIPLAASQGPRHFRERVAPKVNEQVDRAGRERTAGQIMSRSVTTVTEDEPVGVVVMLLLEGGFNQVPVVREGMPVGIVARHDLLHLLLPAGDQTSGVASSG